jgi:transcriptional regulator with GAF, ATPase, and Fis domain
MLRAWPGNVRELLGEVRRAAEEAQLRADKVVHPKYLSTLDEESERPARRRARADVGGAAPLTRESIERALAENAGNVAATARALDVHRKQLYRLFERFGIDVTEKKS